MLQFARPEWFWLLAVVPLLGLSEYLRRHRQLRDWKQLGQAGRPSTAGSTWLWMATALCLVVALARPRWGERENDPRPLGNDFVLAIDLSRSMGAEDAVPDRLALAVESAKSLVKALGSESRVNRVGLVGFAGRGVLLCPLTENLGAVLESLGDLRVGQIEPNGTNLGSAIDASLDALEDGNGGEKVAGSIFLFSDGEDHAGTWNARIEAIKTRGVVVHSLAIGDAEVGHIVPVATTDAPRAGTKPLTYRGDTVLSKRRDEALSALCAASGGACLRLGVSPADLGEIYRSRLEQVARARQESSRSTRLPEKFGLFLVAAFILYVAANGRLSRRRGVKQRSLLRWALILVVAAGASPLASRARDAAKRGADHYSKGRFDQALLQFQEASQLEPENPLLQFNQAAVLFQLHRHAEAYSLYQAARQNADPALRTKIDFTLGNTAVALQEAEAAIAHYNDCIASTTRGPRLDDVRRDALMNKRFVEEQSRRMPALAESRAEAESQPPSHSAPKSQASENSATSGPPPGTGNSPAGGGASPNRSRRTGGGGGSGSSSASANLEEQLDRAVENIKKAKSGRLVESPRGSSSKDLKDW